MPDSRLRAQLEHLLNSKDFETFLEVVERALPGTPGSRTRQNVLSSIRALLRWADHEWRSVLSPDEHLGQDYLNHLKGANSPVTVKNHLSRLKLLYAALLQLDVTDHSPFATLKAPSYRFEESRDAYTSQEIERLLALHDPELRALVLLGAHAGLSARRVVALCWDDIQSRAGELYIYRQPVQQGRPLRDALNALQAGQLDAAPDAAVFRLTDAAQLRRLLYRACLMAGVPPLAWGPLRNHAALRVLEQQADLSGLGITGERSRGMFKRLGKEEVLHGPRRRARETGPEPE